jgi:ribosomal peptide maturation radical SAM protein 1
MGAETVRQCRFVDAAVSGEADAIVPQLVQRILAAEPLDGLPGVRTHANVGLNVDEGRFGAAPMVSPLDALPYPDYEDYFRAFRESRFDRHWYPRLFFETSRGCWWGERMHCTFCGLNGGTMTFRSKSPRRAIDELVTLTSRYPESDVQVVDNILDLRYFDSVLPELAARKLNISLYYETKANLKRPQVALLRQSGITQIQPGIESLSDAVLKLMRKGVTALQNIQLLKWCREFGVDARWNFLWGFPGEPEDEYRRMADWIPLLTHLQPPVGMSPVRLDRFSPNFFDRDRLGFADVRPLPSYRHLYPFDESAVANLAYYFSYGYRVQQDVVAYARPLARALRRWKLVASRSELFAVETDAGLVVCDRRPVRRQSVTVLRGPERTLYRLCDAVSDLSQLQDRVGRDGVLLDSRGLTQHLDRFVSNGLMIRDGSRYLALALSTPPRNVRAAGAQVPLGQYRPSRAGMKLVHRQPVSSTEGRS